MSEQAVRSCRGRGCTDDDCTGCVERTGQPCSWVLPDLCSACVEVHAIAAEGPVLFVLHVSDDALVADAGEELVADMYRSAREVAGDRAQVAVLTSGLTLEVLTDEQLEPLGLQHIPVKAAG